MNRKRNVFLLYLIGILLCLCSCEQPAATTAYTPQPTAASLGFRITWKEYSGRGEAIQKILDEYDAQNPGAVTMIGGDEDINAIQALLDSKASILYVLPYRFVKYFGSKGYIADLTDAFAKDQAEFYPQVWALGCVNDRVYGVPWLGHAMCLLYNQTLLQNAGVDASAINSREALVAAIQQVERNTKAKGIGLVGADSNDISWMVNQFIYGFGGQLVSADGKTVAINSEQSRMALAFYKNVLGPYAQPTWLEDTGTEVMDHFRNQEVAFEIQGIWGVTDIQKNGEPFEVGVISMADVGLCAEVGPMMLAVPAAMDDATKTKAIALMQYLISPKAQEEIMHGEYSPEHDAYYPFRTPIRTDTANSDVFSGYPEYVKFIEGFQHPSVDVPVPAWQVVKDEWYGPGLHKVMTGAMTIEAFLTQIETEGNRILGGN